MKPRYVIIGVVLVAVLATGLHSWFENRYTNNQLYKTQWILNKKNTYNDYVVLGASHSYVGFDIGMADSLTRLKGINLSLDGSLIGTQSILANMYFNRNKNKAKYLLFSIDNPSAINTELLADIADGRMMPYLKYDEVFSFYKPYGIKWYFDRYVPFWKYAEYNYYWGPHVFANTWLNYMKQDFDSVSGSRYDYGYRYDNSDSNLVEISFDLDKAASQYKYFKKVIAVCKENDVRPILFTFPLGRADTSAIARQNLAQFKSYCKDQGLEYVYLGDYLNYQFEYYGTKGHLNKKGAELATGKLMEILMKENMITPAIVKNN